MPTVSNTVTDPAGDPIADVQVVIRLIATIPESTPAAGFLGPDDETIVSQVELTTDALGDWSTNLVANDLITPAGTYYVVSERPDVTPRRPAVKYRISVPDGAGPYWAGDLLVSAPDDLPNVASDASAVSFNPTGVIAATNVQAAIAELEEEVASGTITTPSMFGAVGDGVTDDGVALQAFFDHITANDVGVADVSGTFASSTALTFGDAGVPATLKVNGQFTLQMLGSGRIALTIKNFAGTWDTVKVTGTGSGSTYSSRTWEVGVFLDGSGRSQFRKIEAWVFAFCGVMGGLNNNTLADYGAIRAVDCGSGGTYGLTATWSAPVRNGVSGSTAQTTTLTVDTLPPSYIGSAEYGAVDDAPYLVRITELDGTERLHFIRSVGATTIDVYPWVHSTAPAGTLTYVYGGGLLLRGSDSNVAGFSSLDAIRCGIGLAASSLYGPIGRRLVAQSSGVGIVFGRSPSGAAYGAAITGAYFESNTHDVAYLGIGTNTYAAIDADFGLNLAKSFVMAPRLTDDTFSTNLATLAVGRLTQQGRSHNFEKRPYGSLASSYVWELNRPDEVIPVSADTTTITLGGPDLDLHRLVGYDTVRIVVLGTGTNGAPTGTITFAVPTPVGSEVWTLNGGSASVAFSGFTSGPCEFLARFNVTTLDCKIVLLESEVTSLTGGLSEGLSTVTSGSARTINLANGNVHDHTLVGATTFTFSGSVASKGSSFTLILRQDATGGRTVTWPASVKWPSGSAPSISTAAGAVDILSFTTVDNGTTWYGFLGGVGFA